jgi:nicotinate-nucleotide pyrophosphorylase (carboxylating)
VGGFSLLLDIEVGSEAEADEAIEAGADIVMLDNIEGAELIRVARTLREKWKGKRKFLFETSGNITETNLQERAINGESHLASRSRRLAEQFLQRLISSVRVWYTSLCNT